MSDALLFEPTCSGRGGNEEEINVEGGEENVCYSDTNSVAHCYILSTCLAINISIYCSVTYVKFCHHYSSPFFAN
jgi:hypothetical protein